MTRRPELTRLRNAAARLERAEAAAARVMDDRDEYLTDALWAGATIEEVMTLTGLSRARIYQIKGAAAPPRPAG